jgi:hypothetical protein
MSSNNNQHAVDPVPTGTITGQKRKSRFDTDIVETVPNGTSDHQKRLNVDVSVAAAKAAEISKEIAAKVSILHGLFSVAISFGLDANGYILIRLFWC